jgi:5-methylthioadenosine/S-adenosylhomocysteine deaminase
MATIQKGAQVIRGARLADAKLRRAAAADILIIDGVIREVGAPGMAAPPGAAEMDASGLVVHPGLTNSHMHSHGGLARGQGDRWTLELLLVAAPWIGGNRSLADKKLSATICAAEMALKGCTAAYDLFAEVPLPTADGMDAAAEAYHDVGMRAVIAPMVADRTFYEAIPGLMEALPPALQKAVEGLRPGDGNTCIAAIDGILRGWKWGAHGIHAAVAPTIPHHCSPDFICGCARVARTHGVRLHTHVGESKVQAVSGIRLYGRTLLQQMDAWGLVGPDFTAAHAIWLDDDDMRIMAAKGASVAHNPSSNMKLGNGLFPLRRMLDLGVTVGIGTDGANCSDNQNVYEAMRYASFASKVQSPRDGDWASVEEIYHAATVGGAAVLGLKDHGEIRVGADADLVFLDLNSINWIPHNWTVNQIVHVEDGAAVKHVMVAGTTIVRDRVLTSIDLPRLAIEAEAARDRLEAATADVKRLTEKLALVVNSHCPGLAAQPYQVRRYLCD